MSLATIRYARGRRVHSLTDCPACGYDFDPNEDRYHHPGGHDPENFGLSPLGETRPDHDAPLFGGEAGDN